MSIKTGASAFVNGGLGEDLNTILLVNLFKVDLAEVALEVGVELEVEVVTLEVVAALIVITKDTEVAVALIIVELTKLTQRGQ